MARTPQSVHVELGVGCVLENIHHLGHSRGFIRNYLNMNENLNIEEFNPKIEELKQLVEVTKLVVVTDINDKKQIEIVKANRISLRDVRVDIEKAGKRLREGAVKFQKEVITREKELIAIIEPEEKRLETIEKEVKLKKLRAERIALLPERKKQ